MPALSPDGRWLAYVSDETGRQEVLVRPLAGTGRWQVTSDGGSAPRWSPDGARLYYWHGDQFVEAAVRTAGTFEVGAVRVLFRGADYAQHPLWTNYDVHPDGQHFLMVRAATADRAVLVMNWRGAQP
jgi:dipeptidyl aminopeptidase/acylaminoacyl peptidase